jgi:MoaA/NifB/PqqE/SkfB family radical SAM enzyme
VIALIGHDMRLDDAPPLVIWEISQACDLACCNCRPSAAPRRHSSDLTTEEGVRLLEQIRSFGNPLMVFTGGDPLKRPDLFTLIRKSVALGLRTNIRLSATPLLTREVIEELKLAGVERIAIALEGWDAVSHDRVCGIPGTFDCAVKALEAAREIGLDTQIQTTVTPQNVPNLEWIADLVEYVKARAWSLALAGDELDGVFQKIYDISQVASFDIKTEDARYHLYLRELGETPDPILRAPRGFIFVSDTGEIHPSGFLPVSAGNVRYDSLVDVYRNSSLFSILCTNGTAANVNNAKYLEVRGLALML